MEFAVISDILCIIELLLICWLKKEDYIRYSAIICNIVLLFSCSFRDVFSDSFCILIPFLAALCALWAKKPHHLKGFFLCLIGFVWCSIHAFASDDLLSLFCWIEGSMIPMAGLMLCEEQKVNHKALFEYVAYTFLSSCCLLCAFVMIYHETQSLQLSCISTRSGIYSPHLYYILLFAIGVKLPFSPMQVWVKNVHGKSPVCCSVLLSGVALKFSSLLMVKIWKPLFGFGFDIQLLAALSVLIAAAHMWREKELKTLVAYASVVHMNLYLFVLISGADIRWFAWCLLQHSLALALCFFVADLVRKKGVLQNIRNWVYCALLALGGVPGTWGFASELKVISVIAELPWSIIVLSLLGVVVFQASVVKAIVALGSGCKSGNSAMSNTQKCVLVILESILVIGGIFVIF